MAKKKTKAKKTKNPGSTIPESVTVAPEVNTADLDPKRTAKIKEAAAKAAAEAAAVDKEKAAEEETEAEKLAPKKAEKKADNKKAKAKKNNSKKAAASKNAAKSGKNAKNAKNGKKDAKKKPNRFVQWWKELGSEMKKIHWTNGKDTVKNTLVVLLVILVIGIGVWIVDWLLVKARTGIYNAATPDDAKNAIIMLKAAISYAGLTV